MKRFQKQRWLPAPRYQCGTCKATLKLQEIFPVRLFEYPQCYPCGEKTIAETEKLLEKSPLLAKDGLLKEGVE